MSEKIISSNRTNLILGVCEETQAKEVVSSFLDVLFDPVNIVFVIIIFILGFIDHTRGKDLKSQIVSVGVLGTFVGIFIGIQAFNPDDILNSVNDILVGLKTAFFTSIVGMSVSTILSVSQTLKAKKENE